MYDFSKQFNTDMPNLNSSKFVRFNKNMPPQPHPITDNKYTSLNSYFSFSKALNSMWTNANSILKWTLYIYCMKPVI